MTAFASSLKATAERRRETEDDAIAGLKRAQDDYKDARAGFRAHQRKILQDVFKNVADLIDDDEACDNFMKRKAVAKFAGHDGDQLTDADRGNVWFCALAFVYQATSRAARQRASKHASALRLLYDQSIDADQIAKTIKERGGLQKLADEAAKARRSGTKKRVDHDNAEASAENGEASNNAEVQSADEDDAEPEANNGEENDDAEVGDAEEGADANQRVRFSISEKLTAKIRKYRGKRVKIIALVPREKQEPIKVLRVVKVNTGQR